MSDSPYDASVRRDRVRRDRIAKQPTTDDNLIARVTRFEVIDSDFGRVFTRRPCTIQLSYQDEGRTLKVFVGERDDDLRPEYDLTKLNLRKAPPAQPPHEDVVEVLTARVQELERANDEYGQVIDNFNASTPKLHARIAELEREVAELRVAAGAEQFRADDWQKVAQDRSVEIDRLMREVARLIKRDELLTAEVQKNGPLALEVMKARALLAVECTCRAIEKCDRCEAIDKLT